jgi:hypothetical protein
MMVGIMALQLLHPAVLLHTSITNMNVLEELVRPS